MNNELTRCSRMSTSSYVKFSKLPNKLRSFFKCFQKKSFRSSSWWYIIFLTSLYCKIRKYFFYRYSNHFICSQLFKTNYRWLVFNKNPSLSRPNKCPCQFFYCCNFWYFIAILILFNNICDTFHDFWKLFLKRNLKEEDTPINIYEYWINSLCRIDLVAINVH